MQSNKRSVFNKSEKNIEQNEAPEDRKRERVYIPITFFYIKDLLREFVNHKYFPDSLLSVFAMISVAIAFPFYPILVLIPLLAVVFILTRLHPLVGLMALLFLTFPMFIYQAPLLAWLYALFMAACLFFGYRNTDTITLSYALIVLPFSFLGYLFEIPAFIMGILFLGMRRSIIVTVVTLLFVSMISGITGIQVAAPIVYNQVGFHQVIGNQTIMQLFSPSKALPTLSTFLPSLSKAASETIGFGVSSHLFDAISLALSALFYNIEVTLLQIVIWLIVVFAVSSYIVSSRSGYKGTTASFYSFIILASFLFIAFTLNRPISTLALFGFVLTPLIIFLFELNEIHVIRALDLIKKDFLGKFGEAFEELTSGTHETLNDVANYEETKKELREALLEPTEHREITGAYNIKPAKGILLFGPPGTGKTLIMRALSNEIRARFFYVKTSSLISPYQGEGLQTLSHIFTMVKKHPPSVLFFDEIDGIAGKRESESNENSRQLLSMLLSEMDGFQKLEGVIVVGSTNVPQLLDPGIMRPGRFDKIIYMPLPDKEGRIAVFKYYAKKYPMVSNIDFEKLADSTERFSNADIANVCAEAARHTAETALKQSKILKIDADDLLRVIKSTKPSTSLSRIAEYERFKLDFERRMYHESSEESKKKVSIDDVIGEEEAKKALYEALEVPMLHPQLVKEYDLKNINGILLFGPPGTGKTMLMNAVANEIGEYRMLTISGTEIAKEGYEKAVESIKEIFDRAKENAPSIIFIDEVDSLVPNRDEGSMMDVQITAEFLREFDLAKEVEGIVLVGSTNRPEMIDSAMLRPGRFDKLIFVAPPDAQARALIFQKNLEKAPCEEIDYKRLADMTRGFTGADIANVCREAKVKAVEEGIDSSSKKKITTQDLINVINATKPSAPDKVTSRYLLFENVHGAR